MSTSAKILAQVVSQLYHGERYVPAGWFRAGGDPCIDDFNGYYGEAHQEKYRYRFLGGYKARPIVRVL